MRSKAEELKKKKYFDEVRKDYQENRLPGIELEKKLLDDSKLLLKEELKKR
jgi:hypothetical protein